MMFTVATASKIKAALVFSNGILLPFINSKKNVAYARSLKLRRALASWQGSRQSASRFVAIGRKCEARHHKVVESVVRVLGDNRRNTTSFADVASDCLELLGKLAAADANQVGCRPDAIHALVAALDRA